MKVITLIIITLALMQGFTAIRLVEARHQIIRIQEKVDRYEKFFGPEDCDFYVPTTEEGIN